MCTPPVFHNNETIFVFVFVFCLSSCRVASVRSVCQSVVCPSRRQRLTVAPHAPRHASRAYPYPSTEHDTALHTKHTLRLLLKPTCLILRLAYKYKRLTPHYAKLL